MHASAAVARSPGAYRHSVDTGHERKAPAPRCAPRAHRAGVSSNPLLHFSSFFQGGKDAVA